MNIVPMILLMFLPLAPPVIAEVAGRISDRVASARARRAAPARPHHNPAVTDDLQLTRTAA